MLRVLCLIALLAAVGVLADIDDKPPAFLRPDLVAPVTTTPGEVAVLTSDNFEAIVMDKTKTVFVKFFALWCGHCVKMAPAWKLLAENMADTDDVVVAELNADAHKGVDSQYGEEGLPTIKLFSKGNKAGMEYKGVRTVEALMKFLAESAVR